mmetsp:Transcript_36126/g.105716  ORF Transcript_36126/g.105716 Transcript_36126/m.105716 type:complete len:140 (+) Transcript_36126:10-429(+)
MRAIQGPPPPPPPSPAHPPSPPLPPPEPPATPPPPLPPSSPPSPPMSPPRSPLSAGDCVVVGFDTCESKNNCADSNFGILPRENSNEKSSFGERGKSITSNQELLAPHMMDFYDRRERRLLVGFFSNLDRSVLGHSSRG